MKESTLRNWLPAAFDEQPKEVATLRRANEILKTASAVFAQAGLDRNLR